MKSNNKPYRDIDLELSKLESTNMSDKFDWKQTIILIFLTTLTIYKFCLAICEFVFLSKYKISCNNDVKIQLIVLSLFNILSCVLNSYCIYLLSKNKNVVISILNIVPILFQVWQNITYFNIQSSCIELMIKESKPLFILYTIEFANSWIGFMFLFVCMIVGFMYLIWTKFISK